MSQSPGRRTGGPLLLQCVLVAQRVHRVPVAAMLERAEPALADERFHRGTLEHGRIVLDIVENRRLEDEESTAHPARTHIGLLGKLADDARTDAQLSKTRR